MWLSVLLACGPASEPTTLGGAKSIGPRLAVDTSLPTGDTGRTATDDTSAANTATGDTATGDTATLDTAPLDTAETDTAGVTAGPTGDTGRAMDTGPDPTFDVPDFLAGGWIVFSPDPNTCATVTDDTMWISQVTNTGFVADLGAGKVFDCDLQMVDVSTEAADFTCSYYLSEADWGAITEVSVDVTASVLAGEGTVLFEVEYEVFTRYPSGCTDTVSGYIVQL